MRFSSPLLSLTAAVLLPLAACGLQTSGLERVPTEEDASPSGTTSAPPPPPPADASSVMAYEAGMPPPPDSGSAPPPADAATDAPPPTPGCDEDGDGHAAKGGCGGDDCCDSDARAYPGQTAYFDGPDACNSFDYDCNGKSDPQYGQASCQLDFFRGACGGDGFAAATPCGSTGSFTTCNYAVFSCNTSGSSRVQGCR